MICGLVILSHHKTLPARLLIYNVVIKRFHCSVGDQRSHFISVQKQQFIIRTKIVKYQHVRVTTSTCKTLFFEICAQANSGLAYVMWIGIRKVSARNFPSRRSLSTFVVNQKSERPYDVELLRFVEVKGIASRVDRKHTLIGSFSDSSTPLYPFPNPT